MKIGDEVYIHGYIDEIRNDVVIIKNEGGYFGTVPNEIKLKTESKTSNIPYKIETSSVCKDSSQTVDMFALDMAIAKCKVRHNNCKNCDKRCVWRNEPQKDNIKAVKDLQKYYGIKQEPMLSEMV